MITTVYYQYDANGNRTSEAHTGTTNGLAAATNVTQSVFDAQNRLVQSVDALGRTSSISYNKLGKQATTVDVLGRTNTYTYDAIGNLIQTRVLDSLIFSEVFADCCSLRERTLPLPYSL